VAPELATDILRGLCAVEGEHPTAFPALRDIRIRNHLSMHGPLWDAAQSLNVLRWLSGSHVLVSAAQYSCHLCDTSSKDKIGLRLHLKGRHKYRIVCSFCTDFKWSTSASGYVPSLHREHLESRHPEVTPIPESTSSPAYQSLMTVLAPQSRRRDRGTQGD